MCVSARWLLAVGGLAACTQFSEPSDAVLPGRPGAAPAGASAIAIADLGTLPGGWPSFATDVNAAGSVVGYSYTGANYSGVQHAVGWNPTGNGWTIVDLAAQLTGSTASAARAINAAGDIAGWQRTTSGEDHAFLLSAGGVFSDLGALPGMNASYANDLNTADAVVGYSTALPDPSGQARRAFYYSAGAMVALPTLGQGSEAKAIGDDGTVVGDSYDTAGVEHAVRWSRDGAGVWTISPLPGGTNATATAINVTGNIAGGGCVDLSANGCRSTRGLFWVAADQPPTVMATLGGSVSFVQGMNDAGQLVGWSFSKVGIQHAFYAPSASSALVDLGALGGKTASSTAATLNTNRLVVGSSRVDTRPSQSTGGTHATAWTVP